MIAWCESNIANLEVRAAEQQPTSRRRTNPRRSPRRSPSGLIDTSCGRTADRAPHTSHESPADADTPDVLHYLIARQPPLERFRPLIQLPWDAVRPGSRTRSMDHRVP